MGHTSPRLISGCAAYSSGPIISGPSESSLWQTVQHLYPVDIPTPDPLEPECQTDGIATFRPNFQYTMHKMQRAVTALQTLHSQKLIVTATGT